MIGSTSWGHALDILGDTPFPNYNATIVVTGGVHRAASLAKSTRHELSMTAMPFSLCFSD